MRVRFFQDGGAAGANPVEQLVSMAVQAIQNNDSDLAMQVCQGLVSLAQGGTQSSGASQETAAPQEVPEEETGEPVYRRGGRLVRRIYY